MLTAQKPPSEKPATPQPGPWLLHAQQARDSLRHVQRQVGQVLRAADLVEALQGDPVPPLASGMTSTAGLA